MNRIKTSVIPAVIFYGGKFYPVTSLKAIDPTYLANDDGTPVTCSPDHDVFVAVDLNGEDGMVSEYGTFRYKQENRRIVTFPKNSYHILRADIFTFIHLPNSS